MNDPKWMHMLKIWNQYKVEPVVFMTTEEAAEYTKGLLSQDNLDKLRQKIEENIISRRK